MKMRMAIAPEDVSETQEAAEMLLKDLKDGTPFSKALTTFCMQIIDSDEMS